MKKQNVQHEKNGRNKRKSKKKKLEHNLETYLLIQERHNRPISDIGSVVIQM
mgnify:CR=1 FL=1